MGWTFYAKPKGVKMIDSLKANSLGREWCEKHLVAESATRSTVFFVGRYYEPDSKVYVPDADGYVRSILVYMVKLNPKARDGLTFGYKDMCETSGPYGNEAPASIIEAASPLRDMPESEPEFSSLRSAHEYRARSLRFKKVKANKRALKPGQTVKLPAPLVFRGMKLDEFTVERVRSRHRMITAFRAKNGMLCSIRAEQLVNATIT